MSIHESTHKLVLRKIVELLQMFGIIPSQNQSVPLQSPLHFAPLLIQERLRRIVNIIRVEPGLTCRQIYIKLGDIGVKEQTIRKDLCALEDGGYLRGVGTYNIQYYAV